MSTSNAVTLLCIGGSDSCAGAGIQADLKAASALGVYACTAITAVTAQNFSAVEHIHVLDANIVAAQLDSLAGQLHFDGIKLGLLGSLEVAEVVAEFIENTIKVNPACPVVVDPVLKASSGAVFADGQMQQFYRRRLFSLATLLTPNISEAAALLAAPLADNEDKAAQQAFALCALGCKSVLVKGGHLQGPQSIDQLVSCGGLVRMAGERVKTAHGHGTGCSLATAITCRLAQGLELSAACQSAKQYLNKIIAAADAMNLVERNGPLHHFAP